MKRVSIAFIVVFLCACAPVRETKIVTPDPIGKPGQPPGPAIEGAGSSGGGSGVEENGRIKLRELVEGVTCRWETGHALTAKGWDRLKHLVQFVLDERMHRLLERETYRVSVCFSSSELRTLPETTFQSVAGYRATGSPKQLAIRIDTAIYIDEKAYLTLDDDTRAYLIFHELIHGFIAMETSSRMTRLRDFVANVHGLDHALDPDLLKVNQMLMDPKSRAKVDELREQFARMKFEAGVREEFPLFADEAAAQVARYLRRGDAGAIATFLREGAAPDLSAAIWLLRDCNPDDARPYCLNMASIVGAYIGYGANPDGLFDNREGWTPRPTWEYLLATYGQRGKVRRVELAEQLFHYLPKDDALRARLDKLLLEFSKSPFIALSVEKLVAWGAGIETRDDKGRTPLMVAAAIGKGEGILFHRVPPPAFLVAKLVKLGADLAARDAAGHTALEILEAQRAQLRGDAQHVEQFELAARLLREGKPALPAVGERLEALGWGKP